MVPGRRLRGQPSWPRPSVDKADVVAAVTGDDEDNLVISLLAKQEFGVPRVVARVNNPKNEWMFNADVGRRRRRVDASPHHRPRGGGGVASASFVRLLSFEGGKAKLAEVTLADGLAGRRQGDRPSSACPVTRRWWPCSATTGWSCPAATP